MIFRLRGLDICCRPRSSLDNPGLCQDLKELQIEENSPLFPSRYTSLFRPLSGNQRIHSDQSGCLFDQSEVDQKNTVILSTLSFLPECKCLSILTLLFASG